MAARVVARSALNDLTEGSVLLHILASVSEEIAGRERLLEVMRDSFSLERTSGGMLDERAAEFPPNGLRRRGAVSSSGAVLRLTRSDTVGALTLSPGMTFRRSDDPSQTYRTTGEATWANGQSITTSLIPCVSQRAGAASNCGALKITKIEAADNRVIAVTNEVALTNGADTETDGQLKARLIAYLQSLARCQPAALEYAALSYVHTDGSAIRYAALVEDHLRPGYSELIVDDGAGFGVSDIHPAGTQTRAGVTSSGTVGTGGVLMLWHEAPATAPIDVIRVLRGAQTILLTVGAGHFTSVPERGIVYLSPTAALEAGDVWSISTNLAGTDQYRVFTGVLKGLQDLIEGSPSEPTGEPGLRAAGTRVRVLPARAAWISMDMHIVPKTGATLADLTIAVRDDTIAYVSSLAPGETLYMSRLVATLISGIDDLLTVRIFHPGTTNEMADQEPENFKTSLRIAASGVQVIPAVEE